MTGTRPKRGKTITAWLALLAVVLAGAGAVLVLLPDGGHSAARTVAKIDGIAIDEREFMMLLDEQRAAVYAYFKERYGVDDSKHFWTTEMGGESPTAVAKRRAMDELVRVKVQQLAAVRYGWMNEMELGYGAFLNGLAAENARRKRASEKGEVFYGPVQFDERGYYRYLLSNLTLRLKARWVPEGGSAREQESKYEEEIRSRAAEARVEIVQPVYDGIQMR